MSALDQLKKWTTVVADTGEVEQIKVYKPQDATTNPSLIYQAAGKPEYAHLVDSAVAYAKENAPTLDEQIPLAMDKLAVNFGKEILAIVPGRVSTEIDASLSFDEEATVARAKRIIGLYAAEGIKSERILVKIASTWEGIAAAKRLEAEGIHVNMTLLFSLVQAQAAAEAGATLISPFAGRITDFFKAQSGAKELPPVAEDPGVLSVATIYNYYKTHGYKTVVMGASFRSQDQIMALAGCDLLTIAPKFLKSLGETKGTFERKLAPETAKSGPKVIPTEKSFRWELNQDEMATTKLAGGIRRFAADLDKLAAKIKELLSK